MRATRGGNCSIAPGPRCHCSAGAGENGEYGAILSSLCAAGENAVNIRVQAPQLSGVDIRELNVALVYQPMLGHIPRCFSRSGGEKGGSLQKETAKNQHDMAKPVPQMCAATPGDVLAGVAERMEAVARRRLPAKSQHDMAEPVTWKMISTYGSTRGEYPALEIVVGELHKRGIPQFDRLLCEETDPDRAYQRLGS
jgi:hypothetical protein